MTDARIVLYSFLALLIGFTIGFVSWANADQLISSDSVTHSPAWFNSSSIIYQAGLRATSTLDLEVALSIPVERGTPYNQSLDVNIYSDAGYSSIILATSTTASVTADGTKKFPVYHFGELPNGYMAITVYSDGGDIFGSCTAGTNNGGTNLACSPTSNGVPYFSGFGGGGSTSGVTPLSPASTTLAGNPVIFSGTYTNLGTYDTLRLAISGPSGSFLAQQTLPLINVVNRAWSLSWNAPATGSYSYHGYLYDSTNATMSSSSATLVFDVGTTTPNPAYTFGYPGTTTAPGGTSSTTCDYGTSTAAFFETSFCKLGWFLFVPATSSLENFTTLEQNLSNKVPFGYFSLLKNEWTGIGSTSTASTTIMGPFSGFRKYTNYLDTSISLLPWILLLMFFIRRISRFDFHV